MLRSNVSSCRLETSPFGGSRKEVSVGNCEDMDGSIQNDTCVSAGEWSCDAVIIPSSHCGA